MIAAIRAFGRVLFMSLPFHIWFDVYIHHASNPALRWVGERIYVIRRYVAGARRIKVSDYEDLRGAYNAPGVEIQFGGACPVQGDGILDGRQCYYRSRGEGWQFHVAEEGSDDVFADHAFEHSEYPYIWPEGGWVSADISRRCIEKGVTEFRRHRDAGCA